MFVCTFVSPPYSIDKYRQLPTDDAENKNLDKRVSLLSRDSIFLSVYVWIQVTCNFISCFVHYLQTLRHIRLGELLQEHSSEARLIVM